jgi:hypothetical protein
MPPLAHAGHWLVQLVYVAPLVLMGALFVVSYLRHRREDRRQSRSPRSSA